MKAIASDYGNGEHEWVYECERRLRDELAKAREEIRDLKEIIRIFRCVAGRVGSEAGLSKRRQRKSGRGTDAVVGGRGRQSKALQ